MQEFAYQLGVLLSSYSQAINKQNSTTGSLFQQKTKAKLITFRDAQNSLNDDYLTTCMHYIHQNPWKAGLVDKLEEWKYSSFQEYIGRKTVGNCNLDLLLHLAGYNMLTFYEDSYAVLDTKIVEVIW